MLYIALKYIQFLITRDMLILIKKSAHSLMCLFASHLFFKKLFTGLV